MTADVHVRWGVPSEVGRAVLADCGWLDEVERARVAGLRRADDRARFALARHLLKSLVGELSGVSAASVRLDYRCARCGRPHGRPVVVAPVAAVQWQVSIAHAGDRVVVAASRAGPVGVDVEPIAAVGGAALGVAGFESVALTPAERDRVALLPTAERPAERARLWVGKEAVLKARGEGLRTDPATFDLVTWTGQLDPLSVGDTYVAAVALARQVTAAPVPAVPVPLAPVTAAPIPLAATVLCQQG